MKELTKKERKDSVKAYRHAMKVGHVRDIEFRTFDGWGLKHTEVFQFRNKYRIKPKERTAEQYLEAHVKSGLKEGDTVRITTVASSGEQGWQEYWTKTMAEWVGKETVIIRDWGIKGFETAAPSTAHLANKDETNSHNFTLRFPYFVLEKVESKLRPFKDGDEFYASGIEWIRLKAWAAGIFQRPVKITGDGVVAAGYVIKYDTLLANWETLDGEPCGVNEKS